MLSASTSIHTMEGYSGTTSFQVLLCSIHRVYSITVRHKIATALEISEQQIVLLGSQAITTGEDKSFHLTFTKQQQTFDFNEKKNEFSKYSVFLFMAVIL